MLLQDLGEHLGGRDLDHGDVDPGQLLPLGAGEVQRIERLQARLPDDRDLGPGVLLGRLDRTLGRALRQRLATLAERQQRPDPEHR